MLPHAVKDVTANDPKMAYENIFRSYQVRFPMQPRMGAWVLIVAPMPMPRSSLHELCIAVLMLTFLAQSSWL